MKRKCRESPLVGAVAYRGSGSSSLSSLLLMIYTGKHQLDQVEIILGSCWFIQLRLLIFQGSTPGLCADGASFSASLPVRATTPPRPGVVDYHPDTETQEKHQQHSRLYREQPGRGCDWHRLELFPSLANYGVHPSFVDFLDGGGWRQLPHRLRNLFPPRWIARETECPAGHAEVAPAHRPERARGWAAGRVVQSGLLANESRQRAGEGKPHHHHISRSIMATRVNG